MSDLGVVQERRYDTVSTLGRGLLCEQRSQEGVEMVHHVLKTAANSQCKL